MARNRDRGGIQKGETVWYFDKKLKEWRKGTVFSVNRHHLGIKKRHNAYKGHAKYIGLCVSAANPKPTVPPEELPIRLRALSSWDGWDKKTIKETKAYRFLMNTGLK